MLFRSVYSAIFVAVALGFTAANDVQAQNFDSRCYDESLTTPEIARFLTDWRKGEAAAGMVCVLKVGERLPPEWKFLLSFAILDRFSVSEDYFYSDHYFFWKRALLFELVGYSIPNEEVDRKIAYMIYLYEVIEPINRIPFHGELSDLEHPIFGQESIRQARCFVDNDDAVSPFRDILQSGQFQKCISEE